MAGTGIDASDERSWDAKEIAERMQKNGWGTCEQNPMKEVVIRKIVEGWERAGVEWVTMELAEEMFDHQIACDECRKPERRWCQALREKIRYHYTVATLKE